MTGLPVILRLEGRRCLVVGAGVVARRRVRALLEAGAHVTVVAPQVGAQLAKMGVRIVRRRYRCSDLRGMFLVVIATSDPVVNQRITRQAQRRAVLINRADDPEAGDLVIPAHGRRGLLTVAVYSGGVSASAAAAIRDQLLANLDPDWARLLKLAEPWRRKIQSTVTNARRRRRCLLALTDRRAMSFLKAAGPKAVRRYYQRLVVESGKRSVAKSIQPG